MYLNIVIDSNEIQLLILVFCRILGLLVTAPLLGNGMLIPQVKIGLSLILSYMFFNLIPMEPRELLSTGDLVASIIGELFLGSVLGFSSRLIIDGIQLGGQLIGFQIGFTMANMIDPETNTHSTFVSIFHGIFSLLLFLAINGHHWFILALNESFTLIPPGVLTMHGILIPHLVRISGDLFIVGVKIAAPVVIVLFLSDIVLGVISRLVPQVQVLVVAFPVKIAIGLGVLGISLGYFSQYAINFFDKIPMNMYRLLTAM